MRTYLLREPLGSRSLAAADFPLTLGGPGAVVLVPGVPAGEVVALVGLADGEPFLQPARTALAAAGGADAAAHATVRLGADVLAESAWLADGARFAVADARFRVDAAGDDWTLTVEHEGGANETEPPLYGGSPLADAEELPARQALTAIAFDAPRGDSPGARGGAAAPRVTPLRFGIGLAAAVLLAVLGFLFAASAVVVQVRPDLEPDRVDFAGALDVGVGSWNLVLPGEYRLRVEKRGYVAAEQAVTVTGESNQRFVVPLEKLPGRLAVDTGGVRASVLVDGRRVGDAPGTVDVPAGPRLVAIEAPRHERVERRLEIEGLGREQSLEVALVPAYARVTFESRPAGAQVLVDGKPVGTTPATLEVDAGRRAIALAHPQFRTWERAITVKAGEPQTIGPVELGLPDGRVVVRTQPAGADVSVGGAYRGRSPVTLSLAPDVDHEVVVTRAGFAPATRAVRVAPKGEEVLSIALAAQLGEVRVTGTPADAELFVDGQSRGPANQTLSLPAVAHALEVRKPGLETFRATVTPRPGLPQSVAFELKTAAQVQAARTPASIRTGAGQPMKLLPAGAFTSGSPRREPGRRSNETQRRVELKRPAYLMLRPVTNAEFRQFRKEHLVGAFRQETLDLDAFPVANVTWQEAAAYANWLSQRDGLPPAYVERNGRLALANPVTTGYRLPTEAEWEYAARWNGGANDRKYPWGGSLPIPPKAGNFADANAVYLQGQVLEGYDDGFRVVAPVGSFPPNPLGFYDLGGNVLEWTTDFYTVYPEGGAPVVDPTGPADGQAYAIRGSSWLTANVGELRLSWRDYGTSGRPNLGFRLARYAE